MRHTIKMKDELFRIIGGSLSVSDFTVRYRSIQEGRYQRGEIKLNTLKQKHSPLKVLEETLGMRALDQITVKDIVMILDDYKKEGHNRMGQIFRKVAIDVFKEAQQLGEVPAGFNSAESAKKPHVKILRQRLTFDEWSLIYEAAAKDNYYLQKAMLLAIVTCQRISDLCKMKFSDVSGEYILIEQKKTGSKIALPLALKCDKVGYSIGDVIAMCRDSVLSQFILHHHSARGTAVRGGKLNRQP